jgi:hypothetical protein
MTTDLEERMLQFEKPDGYCFTASGPSTSTIRSDRSWLRSPTPMTTTAPTNLDSSINEIFSAGEVRGDQLLI